MIEQFIHANGLHYHRHLLEPGIVRYSAYEQFTVDGIVYDYSDGTNEIRPMIDLLDDNSLCDCAIMLCSYPPTEAELDDYVLNGRPGLHTLI